MKKKWINYFFAAAIVFTGVTAFFMPNAQDNYYESMSGQSYIQKEINPKQPIDSYEPSDTPLVDPKDPAEPIEKEIIYTLKNFSQYNEDFDIPSCIAESNVTGSGTQTDPYIINSTEDFIFMGQQSFTSKYIQINCDIVLNDETFDEQGNPSGGDGDYYAWQPITRWNDCYVDGNYHTISGVYFNDISAANFAIFGSRLKELENLNIDNFYAVAKIVCGVYYFNTTRYMAARISNVHMLNGTVKASRAASGLFWHATRVENCSNRANIFQIETSETSFDVGGISVGSYAIEINDCINYGNITKISLAGSIGGITASGRNVIKNCKNYGDITNSSTVKENYIGGIVGIIREPNNVAFCEITDCINYGNLSANVSPAGSFCGYFMNKAIFSNCLNYGALYTVSGFAGYGGTCDFYDCVNYGKITDAHLFINATWNGQQTVNLVRCKNYGDVFIETAAKSFSLVVGQNAGNINILDCKFYGSVNGIPSAFRGLTGQITGISNITIKNVEITMDFNIADATFYILDSDGTGGKIDFSNVIINTKNVNLRLAKSIWNGSELNIKN